MTSPTNACRPRGTARDARSPSSSSSRGTFAPPRSPPRRGRTRGRSGRRRGANTRRSGSARLTRARARRAPSASRRTRPPGPTRSSASTRPGTRRANSSTSARGTLLKYAWDLNPFLYALSANIGYRQDMDGGGGAGLVGLGFDFVLPIGQRLALGLSLSAFVIRSAAISGPESCRASCVSTTS